MPRCVPIATGLASQQGLAHLVPIIAILVGVTAVEAFEGIGRASDGLSTSSFLTKGEQGQYPHGEGVGSNGNIAEHQQSHQAYDQSPRQPARSQQAPPQQCPTTSRDLPRPFHIHTPSIQQVPVARLAGKRAIARRRGGGQRGRIQPSAPHHSQRRGRAAAREGRREH